MPDLKLRVLGSLHLERDGQPVKVERRIALALLIYLAVTSEHHRREALAALFWPDYDHVRARTALRRELAALKKALAGEALEADRETIGLLRAAGSSGLWLDADEFHNLLATCRSHGHPETEVCPNCLKPLTDAVALYRGDFLLGFTLRDSPDFDDWQLFQAETLRRELAGVLERLVRGYSSRQEFEPAVGYARRWLMLDPFHEAPHCHLMSLYVWMGQRQAALRQYTECARLLERELGVPPQAATTQLYEAIKKNVFAPAAEPLYSLIRPREEQHVRSPSFHSRQSKPTYSDQSLSLLDRIVRGQLVGREREVAQMNALWNRTAIGEGKVLLVGGEAGVGKTRLVREITATAEASAARVLIGRCEAEGGAPYAPIAQIIRAAFDNTHDVDHRLPDFILADLLTFAPQLHPRYPQTKLNPPLDPQFEQQRLFESFVSWCEILADHGPLLLWVEDVHWADGGTLSLLHHLAYRVRSMRLLLVMTYRDTEVELTEARALKEVVLELNRERLAETLKLVRLNREQTRDLLATMLATGGEIAPEFQNSVYRETEGNPFFIEEVCKALIEEGKLYFAGGFWRRSDIETIVIPQSIRVAILSRVEKLPSSVQEMLQLAAILGREFDFPTLKAMSEWKEEMLIGALEHAEQAQLLDEAQRVGHIQFAFTHSLIPFTLRESLSGLRLQRLHRRAVRVLEAQRPDDFEALAHHCTAAGERGKAIDYSCRAAERAEALYAYDTAIQHLFAALNMIEARESPETRLSVLEQLADVHRLRGEHAEAILIYQQALSLTGADKWIAIRLDRKIGETFLRLRSHVDIERFEGVSQSSLEHGLKLTEDEPPHPETVRLLTTLANDAWGTHARHDWDSAERNARAAIEMAELLDVPIELSAALDALATVYGVRGLFRERVQLALRRVALSREVRFTDLSERCNILCQTGNALQVVGEYIQALPYLMEAEKLAGEIRDVNQQVYALGLQAQCFFGLDRWDEMLQIEEKRATLEERYGRDRVDRMCFYCGLSANVLARRGEYERAHDWREIAYDTMLGFWGGPPETWPRPGHY